MVLLVQEGLSSSRSVNKFLQFIFNKSPCFHGLFLAQKSQIGFLVIFLNSFKLNLMKIWYLVFIFSVNAAMAQSLFELIHVAKRISLNKKFERLVYQNGSGISNDDLKIPSELVESEWDSLMKSGEVAVEDLVYIEVFSDLNFQSAKIWERLVNCYGNDLDKLKEDYRKNRINCRNSNSIKEELQTLQTNVFNFLKTSVVWSDFILNTPDFKLPIVHPLMGQIVLGAYAHFKMNVTRAFKKVTRRFTGKHSVVMSNQISRLKDNCTADSCPADLNQTISSFILAERILTSGETCHSYGLWPNTTLFLFSEMNISSFNGYSWVGKVNHPMIKDYDPVWYKSEVLKDEENGVFINYFVTLRENPLGMPKGVEISTVYPADLSGENLDKYLVQINEKHFPSNKKYGSCWNDSHVLIDHLQRKVHLDIGDQAFAPSIESYNRSIRNFVENIEERFLSFL